MDVSGEGTKKNFGHMAELTVIRFFALAIACSVCSMPHKTLAESSHALFPSGYPRVEYRNGTNTFKLFMALDRAGTAFFVAVPRVDPITSTAMPTPDEILAGNASVSAGEVAAAAGSLTFTDPDTERMLFVAGLPDESTFDLYFATQSGRQSVSGNAVASPTSATISKMNALVIGDVTPPLFVMGTPHTVGHGSTSITVLVAASEQNSSYHVIILPSGSSPPRTALEVYNGILSVNTANAAIVFKGSGPVPFFDTTPVTFVGDLSPGSAYKIYLTIADRNGNVNPVVQVVHASTKYCMPCPIFKVLAVGTRCECVVPIIFTLRVLTTGNELVNDRDALKASVAEQLGVAVSQVAMMSWERAVGHPGYMMVTLSVLPFSASDNSTTAAVASALASVNLNIGGAPSEVSDLVLSGEPDTRILFGSRNRPKGRTNPMTEDGSIPGQPMEDPEPTNRALFHWKVWFDDIECTACMSQCKLDNGHWTSCTSPKVYYALPQGEHNFFVRGLGGDGVPDSNPARYTWTIRYRTEIFFGVDQIPPAFVNSSNITFSLSSNKRGAMFQYSFNSYDEFPVYRSLPQGVSTVKVNSSVGVNIFAARAIAEGEISTTVAKHTWVYDIYQPFANVTTSAVKNGSMVNKLTNIQFVVFGNDTDPTFLPNAGVEEIWIRFMRVKDSATSPPPLFDWRLADHIFGAQTQFTLASTISGLPNGMYVLSARAVDKAGNSRYTDDAYGHDHYYFELSDQVPGMPIVSSAITVEDVMTAVNNTVTGERQLRISSTIPSAEAYAYFFTDIRNGQLFWPDGVTEIFDGDYVLAANVSDGLRYLPSKDLNNKAVLLDGTHPIFSFTVRSAGSLDNRALVDTPVIAYISVLSANDPPVLDPDEDYHLTGLYVYDAVSNVTNIGDSVFDIVNKGFSDIDEGYNSTRANMGMVILSADSSRGVWHWSDSAGMTWHDFPEDLSPERPLLVRAGFKDRLRYFPKLENGVPLDDLAWTASITFRAWDGVSGHVTGSRGQWFFAEGYPLNATLHPAAEYNDSLFPPPQASKFIYYDATSFDAGGFHSMTIASAYIELYGIRYGAYVRANRRDTELERLRQEKARQSFCPPDHGSALRLPVHDRNASVSMRVDRDTERIIVKPPWTVEAWVRRDVVTNEQTLFSDPLTGGAILLGLAPGTGISGVILPHQSEARKIARHNFYSAKNNTAADHAAAQISMVEAACPRWNFSLPLNKWTHLAFVALPDGESYRSPRAYIRLYVDGLYLGSIGPDAGMNMPLGTIGSPGRAAFAIDEVKYWSSARTPYDLFYKKGLFLAGDEPGLVSYLALEEGCGNTTHDMAAAASSEAQSIWDIHVTNATWERQILGLLRCAEILAVTSNHVSSGGGITITLHGAGFRRPQLASMKYSNHQVIPPALDWDWRNPICRFGYRGRTLDVPATIVSSEIVTCPAATWSDANMMRGFVSVEFCDMGMSCCSSPARLDVPRPNIYPANYMPQLQNMEVNTQVLYRHAKATGVWPLNFETFTGTMIMIRGWGFAPLTDDVKLGYRGHDDNAYCNYTTVLFDSADGLKFTTSSVRSVQSRDTPNASAPLYSKMLNSSEWEKINSIANESGKSFTRWFSVPAHIISGSLAVCETPVLPHTFSTTRAVVHLHVSLMLNNGAMKVNVGPQLNWPVRAVFPDKLRVTRVVADDLNSKGVFIAEQDGGTVLMLSTTHTDPAADPSCQFGSVKVHGRLAGLHNVECVLPMAQGPVGDSKVVEVRFTLFSGASRHDSVYSRLGDQAITMAWSAPANLIALTPSVLTLDSVSQGEVHIFGSSFPADVAKVACFFGNFTDWGAQVPTDEAVLFATSLAVSVLRCSPPKAFMAIGFFPLTLNVAPAAKNVFSHAGDDLFIMFRLNPSVSALGADAGPTNGGWLVSLYGDGFLPGDGCALVVSGGNTDKCSTPGYFVSSAILRCEAPDLTRVSRAPTSAQVSETGSHDPESIDDSGESNFIIYEQSFDRNPTLRIHLAVPGGWDGQTLVQGTSGSASATTFQPVDDLDIISPAYLPASGGTILHLTGHNLLTQISIRNRGRCSIGTYDVATRPASALFDQIIVECVTPALLPSHITKTSGLHVAAVPAYPSGLVGSNVTTHPIGYAPILARVTSMLVGSPAPLEGTIGPGLEIFTSLSFASQKNETITTSSRSLKDLSSGTMKLVCFVPEYNHSLVIEEPENEAEDANHLQQHRHLKVPTTMQTIHALTSPNSNGKASRGCCSLPRAPKGTSAGFSTMFVGPTSAESLTATTALLSVEFEYAFSPEPYSFSTHSGTVPIQVLDSNVRFQHLISSRGRGFYVASDAATKGEDTILDIAHDTMATAGGKTGKVFHGCGKMGVDSTLSDGCEHPSDDESAVIFNRDVNEKEEKMDLGCAWWHGSGAGTAALPIHIVGQDFRRGAGMLVRFGGNPESAGASSRQSSSVALFESSALDHMHRATINILTRMVMVPAHFVSSVIVKVEPPQSKQLKLGSVPLAVTGNGGASFSTRTLLYSQEFPN